METEYDIFFSYSHRDGGFARQLVRDFEQSGLRVFLAEKDIRAGDIWESRIRDALLASERIVLLITPRSIDSPWVAAEAGAGWALQKDLIAALMFVEPDKLIDPIRRYQGRPVETEEQVKALIADLAPKREKRPNTNSLSGQWVDPDDDDTVFFKQVQDRVVGFYDFGSGSRVVGVYQGTFNGDTLDYSWHWIDRGLKGRGIMRLDKRGQTLTGEWWYDSDKKQLEKVEYHRISGQMPKWLDPERFSQYKEFLMPQGS